MPHITTCSKCGKAYEESSEENAYAPLWVDDRLCNQCFKNKVVHEVKKEDAP